jgi:cellulose synthase/poly-beta-1,6-N-acetylglucosamine synthase-like glycosyltransferase
VAALSDTRNPLISIITAVYNGRRHLEETIKSVIEQDYENIQYIIIDGGSTDGTLNCLCKGIGHEHEKTINHSDHCCVEWKQHFTTLY